MTCQVCQRQLVPQREWLAMTTRRRKTLNKTHAAAANANLCKSDYVRVMGATPELGYTGVFVRDGLIWRGSQRDQEAS